ncbi:hypothetical protein D3C77_305620 [compost metagenome]
MEAGVISAPTIIETPVKNIISLLINTITAKKAAANGANSPSMVALPKRKPINIKIPFHLFIETIFWNLFNADK